VAGGGDDEEAGEGSGPEPAIAEITKTPDDGGVEGISLADNRCDKIWEGPLRERAFNSFKAKNCPTDTIAKDALGVRWIGQWDLAKNFVPEDEL
jgi:U4/U6 small nuclear ribonucleoprotein PRP3